MQDARILAHLIYSGCQPSVHLHGLSHALSLGSGVPMFHHRFPWFRPSAVEIRTKVVS